MDEEKKNRRPTQEEVDEIRRIWKEGGITKSDLQGRYPFDITRILYNTGYFDQNYTPPIRYKQRGTRGEKNKGSKLTRKQVRDIRFAHSMGAKSKDLANKYGVSYSAIRNIVNYKKWKKE